jgi:oligosaccharide repeat unit polymerase
LRLFGNKIAHPVVTYLAVWGSLVAISTLPAIDLRPIQSGTWLLIAASTAGFLVGSIHVWLFQAVRDRARSAAPIDSPRYPTSPYNDALFAKAYWAGIAALTVFVGMQIAHFAPIIASIGGWRSVLGGEGLAFRRAYLEVAFRAAETNFATEGFLSGLLGYVLFALGMQAVCWSGHLARRRQWFAALLPLVLMAVYSIVAVERAAFIYTALLCLFSFYYHTRAESADDSPRVRARTRPKPIATILTIILVVAAMIYIPLKLRDPTLTVAGTADSVLEYFTGPFGALNAYVADNPRIVPEHLWLGAYSFWGAASVMLRLGAPITLPPNWLEFVAYQAHGDRLTNVYTWLLYFVLDFGWAGVVLIPYLIGGAATAVYHEAVIRRHVWWIPTLCILMTQIVMSFFAFSLIRDFRFDIILFSSPMLSRLVRRSDAGLSCAAPAHVVTLAI